MGYKMKGPSMYNGLLGKNLNVKKDYAGQADGRATSSPFQQTEKQKANLPKEIVNAIAKKEGNSPLPMKGKTMAYQKKTKEDYMKDGFNQKDADQMMKDGAVTGMAAGGIKGKKTGKKATTMAMNRTMKKLMKTKKSK